MLALRAQQALIHIEEPLASLKLKLLPCETFITNIALLQHLVSTLMATIVFIQMNGNKPTQTQKRHYLGKWPLILQ